MKTLILLSALSIVGAISGCEQFNQLHVDAKGHAMQAKPETTGEAALVVAVNSHDGPVTGLEIGNFQTHAGPVGAGGCHTEITRVVSGFDGRYLLTIAPITSNPNCVWKNGLYVISVMVTQGSSTGVGVADLALD